jgi:hypothetical protein
MSNKSDYPKFPNTGCKISYLPRHDFRKCATCRSFINTQYGKSVMNKYLDDLGDWYEARGHTAAPETGAD